MEIRNYDVCVIGGGINGVGIARDAALQGLSVCLLEQSELAAGTSSKSTKIIHGGLRYLENYDFKMVGEALRERAILMDVAPDDLITPMEFILPHEAGLRPFAMLWAGVKLYNFMAPDSSIFSQSKVSLRGGNYGAPLQERYKNGLSYYDGWTNDTALVRANAADAKELGADIFEHQAIREMRDEDGVWRIKTDDKTITARMAVNATGPWVRQFTGAHNLDEAGLPDIRLVKGSHIIVPRQYDGDHAYILQQDDGRIIFAIPYNDDQTLIGTTEEDFAGDPKDAKISQSEIQYLCAAFNRSFENKITPDDIIGTYSGVRPLMDDGTKNASKASRDHSFYKHKKTAAPLWSLYGGKLTTYRSFAEEVTRAICKQDGRPYAPHTLTRKLPAGFHI